MLKKSQKCVFRKAFVLCVLFLSFNLSAFAQADSAFNQQNQNLDSQTLASQNQGAGQNQASLPSETQNWNWSSNSYGEDQRQPSTLGLFFKMVFALFVVVALAYLALRILKRTTKLSNSDDPFLRHVSHLSLSSNRSVDVVTILDHAYILGVSDNAVNLVGEITDKELVDSMNLYADKNDNTKRPRSFNDILSIFMPNSNPNMKNQNIYGSSSFNASELLRRQRERLNENENGGE